MATAQRTSLENVSYSERQVSRTEAHGRRGMVTAKHTAAVRAGLQVLEQGGNAVDAAVAVGFAVGVVEPMSSGLGGGGFMTVCMADGRKAIVDYQVRASLSAHETMYRLTADFHADGQGFVGVEDDANFSGPCSSGVPGLTAGMALAAATFGSRPLAELVEPAIALADEGFAVEWPLMLSQAGRLALLQRFPATAAVYLKDGLPLVPAAEGATILRLPELAATLRRIAAEGREGFYAGPTARAIAAEMERLGGNLGVEDLRRFEAKLVDPPVGSYEELQLVALAPPASGCMLLETFNILEGMGLRKAGWNTAAGLHLTIEALRRSHADRLAFLGDPEFVEVPLAGLVDKGFAASRRATIDRGRYQPAEPGDPWAYMPARAGGVAPWGRVREEGTTHFSVVDAAGNAVAATQTITSAWGSGVTVPGTGVLLNNGMTLFDPRPGTANSIAPGKRPASSMAHTIVLREGEVVAIAGAPGGRRILDTVTQVLLNRLVHGRGIQDAVSGPFVDTSTPETAIDDRVPADVRRALEAQGHRLQLRHEDFFPSYFARPMGISRDPASGNLAGGADPYHTGAAGGI